MSDAFHLLSDVASFIVALVAIYLAEKPATKSKEPKKIIESY
jgi:Co/Zn/Cd efflux system component